MQHPTSKLPALGLGLLTLCAALWLSGCVSKPITANVPPPHIDELFQPQLQGDVPETMLDWHGTYQAMLPCNGCAGVAIHVALREDKTAVVHERRVSHTTEETPTALTYSGPFRFDPPGGSLIRLQSQAQDPVAYHFFVGEGWIEMRERVTGSALSATPLYRLRKTGEPVR